MIFIKNELKVMSMRKIKKNKIKTKLLKTFYIDYKVI